MIVAIEGIDASGKKTHSRLLAHKLGATVISFPVYSTHTGQLIKQHLEMSWRCFGNLMPASEEDLLNARVFQCLNTVNRIEMLPTIQYLLAAGRKIVFDRYYASAHAYGEVDGLSPQWLTTIHGPLPKPDLWILLDVPVVESLERRPERRDRIEADFQYLARTRGAYLNLFKKSETTDPGRWAIVDGVGSIDTVAERIWQVVEPFNAK